MGRGRAKEMTSKVLDFLVVSGGSSFDELVARVPSRPQNLVEELHELTRIGMVETTGARTVEDLERLVERVRAVNGYDHDSKLEQRSQVIDKMFDEGHEFGQTTVRLTRKGLANVIS
jgi:hypothetical protein